MIFKKILAFTLAETLIVMGIIGIVSALTIPNLNSSTADKEKIVKVKKIYQNLNDALGRVEAVYGPLNEWNVNTSDGTNTTKMFAARMLDFMKTSKDCQFGTSGCVASGGIASNGSFYSILTADKTSISFMYDANNIAVYIDIDGPNKGTTKVGKDLFYFYIPLSAGNISYASPGTSCNNSGGEDPCTGWVIEYENMDYLKLKDGKCPDGKTVLDSTNTSCK